MIRITTLTILLVASFSVATHVFAQQEEQKLTKDEKKQLKEEAQQADFDKSVRLAEMRQFVFVADEMTTSAGIINVDARTNFFLVNGENATFQFAFYQAQGIPNPNGLGGVTSHGRITKYSYSAKNPKKPVSVEVLVKPKAAQGLGIHLMVVNMFGGGFGELILPSGTVRLKGRITTLEEAKIVTGGSY